MWVAGCTLSEREEPMRTGTAEAISEKNGGKEISDDGPGGE